MTFRYRCRLFDPPTTVELTADGRDDMYRAAETAIELLIAREGPEAVYARGRRDHPDGPLMLDVEVNCDDWSARSRVRVKLDEGRFSNTEGTPCLKTSPPTLSTASG